MITTDALAVVPPMKITGLLHGRWAVQALKTALEVELFSYLADKALSAQELALRANLNQKATQLLLSALVSMDYLTFADEQYDLTEVSRLYLVKSSQTYFGNYVLAADLVDIAWRELTNALKDGKQRAMVNNDQEAAQFFPKLAENIFPINYTTAAVVARQLKVESLNTEFRVLDLACGSAVWSIPFAELNKHVRVDALDFPPVLEVAKRFAAQHEVGAQYNFLPGNWRDVSLEKNTYDVVTLGHILHSEGKELSIALVAKAVEVLKPGGTLVVAEFLSNDERNGPIFAALFALNMFLLTEKGCVFSVSEMTALMQEQGLKDVNRLHLPFWGSESPVMVGRK